MMSMNLKDYVRIYDNFLHVEDCAAVIKKLKKRQWIKHAYYDYVNNNNVSYDDDLFVCNDIDFPESEFINKQIWHLIKQHIEDYSFPWYPTWSGYTQVRYNWYKKNTLMRNHCDHIQSMFDGERKGIPTLSILGALNDNYEGGELVFWETEKIQLKAGQVIIFPSNFLYPHKVDRVTKGSRYSFVSWVW